MEHTEQCKVCDHGMIEHGRVLDKGYCARHDCNCTIKGDSYEEALEKL
jgi:hypothetical protein